MGVFHSGMKKKKREEKEKHGESTVMKQDDLCVLFGWRYRGNCRGAAPLEGRPFFQLVRGWALRARGNPRGKGVGRWFYTSGTIQYPHSGGVCVSFFFLLKLFMFPLIRRCLNAPDVPAGRCNVFPPRFFFFFFFPNFILHMPKNTGSRAMFWIRDEVWTRVWCDVGWRKITV